MGRSGAIRIIGVILVAWISSCSCQITVTSVTPTNGYFRGGYALAIYGTGFSSSETPSIKVGGRECWATVYASNQVLGCIVPEGSGSDLSVKVEYSSSAAELDDAFTYDDVKVFGSQVNAEKVSVTATALLSSAVFFSLWKNAVLMATALFRGDGGEYDFYSRTMLGPSFGLLTQVQYLGILGYAKAELPQVFVRVFGDMKWANLQLPLPWPGDNTFAESGVRVARRRLLEDDDEKSWGDVFSELDPDIDWQLPTINIPTIPLEFDPGWQMGKKSQLIGLWIWLPLFLIAITVANLPFSIMHIIFFFLKIKHNLIRGVGEFFAFPRVFLEVLLWLFQPLAFTMWYNMVDVDIVDWFFASFLAFYLLPVFVAVFYVPVAAKGIVKYREKSWVDSSVELGLCWRILPHNLRDLISWSQQVQRTANETGRWIGDSYFIARYNVVCFLHRKGGEWYSAYLVVQKFFLALFLGLLGQRDWLPAHAQAVPILFFSIVHLLFVWIRSPINSRTLNFRELWFVTCNFVICLFLLWRALRGRPGEDLDDHIDNIIVWAAGLSVVPWALLELCVSLAMINLVVFEVLENIEEWRKVFKDWYAEYNRKKTYINALNKTAKDTNATETDAKNAAAAALAEATSEKEKQKELEEHTPEGESYKLYASFFMERMKRLKPRRQRHVLSTLWPPGEENEDLYVHVVLKNTNIQTMEQTGKHQLKLAMGNLCKSLDRSPAELYIASTSGTKYTSGKEERDAVLVKLQLMGDNHMDSIALGWQATTMLSIEGRVGGLTWPVQSTIFQPSKVRYKLKLKVADEFKYIQANDLNSWPLLVQIALSDVLWVPYSDIKVRYLRRIFHPFSRVAYAIVIELSDVNTWKLELQRHFGRFKTLHVPELEEERKGRIQKQKNCIARGEPIRFGKRKPDPDPAIALAEVLPKYVNLRVLDLCKVPGHEQPPDSGGTRVEEANPFEADMLEDQSLALRQERRRLRKQGSVANAKESIRAAAVLVDPRMYAFRKAMEEKEKKKLDALNNINRDEENEKKAEEAANEIGKKIFMTAARKMEIREEIDREFRRKEREKERKRRRAELEAFHREEEEKALLEYEDLERARQFREEKAEYEKRQAENMKKAEDIKAKIVNVEQEVKSLATQANGGDPESDGERPAVVHESVVAEQKREAGFKFLL